MKNIVHYQGQSQDIEEIKVILQHLYDTAIKNNKIFNYRVYKDIISDKLIIQVNNKEYFNIQVTDNFILDNFETFGFKIVPNEKYKKHLSKFMRKNINEDYWYLNEDLDVESVTEMNYDVDDLKYKNGNYFGSETVAKAVKESWILYLKLLKFKVEYDEVEPDWNNSTEAKYFINMDNGMLRVDKNFTSHSPLTVYFSTYLLAERAIEQFKPLLEKVMNINWDKL